MKTKLDALLGDRKSAKLLSALSLCLGALLCTSQLLGVHGAESSLVIGIALSPFAAAAAARHAIGFEDGVALVATLLKIAARAWLPATLLLALNQLRVRNCEPWSGLALVFLGGGVSLLLASFVGGAIGARLSRAPRRATALAFATPIAGYLGGLYAFWSTPAIFVFNHFGGWFPGTLYDEGVALSEPLVTFRLITLLWIFAIGLLLATSLREGVRTRPRPWALAAILALVSLAIGITTRGDDLHHRTSSEFIQAALGRTIFSARCAVHLPRELPVETARRLAEDCDFRVRHAEAVLGVVERRHVHAYFYRSAAEKQRLMGAGHVYIAKPWRAEVHLQLGEWPHAVLAHEIVHVIAANMSEGPFRVGGSARGYLPNPGWIEGVAVAVEWPEREGMNPHQQVRALTELGRAPPLERVFGLSFLGLPASIAYASAGSFVRFLLDTRGAAVVREAHRLGDVEAATGDSLDVLEREWRALIAETEISDAQLALAQLRFSGSSIFGTTCPHRLARLQAQLAGDQYAGDWQAARATCEEILSIESADLQALLALPSLDAKRGDLEAAERAMRALEGAPASLRARARENLADARWLRGDREGAAAAYDALLQEPLSEGVLRGIEVKRLGIARGGQVGSAIRDFLVGVPRQGAPSLTSGVAVHLSRQIAEGGEPALGAYLEARQLMAAQRYDLALAQITRARASSGDAGLPSERLRDEALRMEAIIRYANQDLEGSQALFQEALRRPKLAHEARDWLARIDDARAR